MVCGCKMVKLSLPVTRYSLAFVSSVPFMHSVETSLQQPIRAKDLNYLGVPLSAKPLIITDEHLISESGAQSSVI